MTANETKLTLETAIEAMSDTSNPNIFDVTIICTTDDYQSEYWSNRLSEGICRSSNETEQEDDSSPNKKKVKTDKDSTFPIALAVSEDWGAGGAGNGLGTLYAFQKACRVAKEKYGIDLNALLTDKKVSAAIYHTAGKGTRLAPLPASENNNKPGVKLPFCHELSNGKSEPITVLEAVVKQTGVYAQSRVGRLSVFWGDQVFIPSAPFIYTPTHHVDIMCTLGESAPTAEEWIEQGLDKYGVIAVLKGEEKNAAQVEKVDHATATRMLKSLGDIERVGPSLGSFSVSAEILNALCVEYAAELEKKEGKFDTDPHFWMPLTLNSADYVSLMGEKGVEEKVSIEHHLRMSKMKQKFDMKGMGLFGAVDVGKNACWWDYGQLKFYFANNMKIIDTDENSELLRKFLGITSKDMKSSIDSAVSVDEVSCIFSSNIMKSGSVTKSVLASVTALEIEAEEAIIVNCAAKKIKAGKGAILYNIVDDSEEGIVADAEEVIVSVTQENGGTMTLKSKLSVNGGTAWKTVLEGNEMSFEQMHTKNKNSKVALIEEKRNEFYKKVSSSFSQ